MEGPATRGGVAAAGAADDVACPAGGGDPAAAAGGVRDAVVDGQTGLIAKNEDIDDIANKISQLLDNDSLRQQMGEAGKAYAREHDWSNIVNKFIDKYKQYSR